MKYSHLIFSLALLSAVTSTVAKTDACESYLADMDFMEYVTCYSYPVASHIVVTDDQHELTLFRLQAKNSIMTSGKPVVLLWHGLLDCGDTWIANEENFAPAFVLANQGYDVWVGNSRGTKYSLGHRLYDQRTSEAFWNFSWMEMSELDLPAAFEFVARSTGQKINYIGHSQGTTQMFAALANPSGKNEKITKNLKKFAALGPVAYTGHVESPFFTFLAKSNTMIEIAKYMGKYGLFLPGWTSTSAAKIVCMRWKWMCSNLVQQIADRNSSVNNMERMKVFGAHFPSPTSVRNLLHWRQGLLNNGVFRKYDFGEAENLRRYGQKTPPVYDPNLITEDIAMFVGTDDLLAVPTDATAWFNALTNSKKSYHQYRIGHLTFLMGKELAYMNDLLEFLKN